MVVGTVSTECWWYVGQVSLTLSVYPLSEAVQGRSDNNQIRPALCEEDNGLLILAVRILNVFVRF